MQTTGFVLEYKVGKLLKQSGWEVIANRYYLDDLSKTPREIDILAYKDSKVKNINSYTCLLISCKKSEENDWVFMTKKSSEAVDIGPRLITNKWTNDKLIEALEKQSDNEINFRSKVLQDEDTKSCYTSDKEAFAFQEVNKSSQKAQNDKPIFASINSLVKAVSYEMSKLPGRNTRPTIYNFHLISIAETDIYECYMNDGNTQVNQISHLLYKNKFIVDMKEKEFIVDFVTHENFKNRLNIYDKLHDSYESYYQDLLIEFYSDIINDRRKQRLHKELYNRSIDDVIENFMPYDDREMFDILGVHTRKNEVGEIELKSAVFQGQTLDSMTNNQQFISRIRRWFKTWYFLDAPVKLEYDSSYDHELEYYDEEYNDDYYE